MASKQVKFIGALLALVIAALAAYWFWSPVLTLRSMRAAVVAGDADAFNRHVDYPRVRDSIKAQLGALIDAKIGTDSGTGAVLGAALGRAFGGALVDAMVRPATLMTAMQAGKVSLPGGLGSAAPPGGASAAAGGGDANADDLPGKPKIATHREGPNRFLIDVTPRDSTRTVTLVLERSGFADWKLTELRVPALR